MPLLPFHIDADTPATTLLELSDGRFQLVTPCAIGPFLYGYDYLILENPLAEFLAGLDLPGVTQEKAVLVERASGKEFFTHTRLRVSQSFKTDQIRDLPLNGFALLILSQQYYFVSPSLKLHLEASPFSYLVFSEWNAPGLLDREHST